MKISTSTSTISKQSADLVFLPLSSDDAGPLIATYAGELGGGLHRAGKDFTGKKGEYLLVYPASESIGRVALLGIGPASEINAETLRRVAAKGAKLASECKAKNVRCVLPNVLNDPETEAEAWVEGFILAGYQFLKYKTDTDVPPQVSFLTLHIQEKEKIAVEQGARQGQIIAEATNFARDLVNASPDDLTAVTLAERAMQSAISFGYKATVWDKKRIEKEKMGGLLAVNKGSEDPPTFTFLEWKPKNALNAHPIIFIGKGVVFDTGGLSLKETKDSMDKMKYDMAGAAAVIGAIEAVARLALPIHLVVLVPATDNRPGKKAYLPTEVVTMHSGKTVEVLNTDAEGRMILADALSYAKRYKPELVVDLATLTGAQVVALGRLAAAFLTNETEGADERLAAFREAGQRTGERIAPLPMFAEYADLLKSNVADLKNVGGRAAGTITAAKFLEAFVDYPWVHLDIAGTVFQDKAAHYRVHGGTGYGVRLLVEYLRAYVRNV